MALMRVHTEVTVTYNNNSRFGLWTKEGQITGIDDTGIMVRESGTEYFIPWDSVVHVTLTKTEDE